VGYTRFAGGLKTAATGGLKFYI